MPRTVSTYPKLSLERKQLNSHNKYSEYLFTPGTMPSLPTSGDEKYSCHGLWEQVAQSYLTPCDPMDCTVHGILQARTLEWVGSLSLLPGDLSNPGIEPKSPALQVDSLPAEPQGKPKNTGVGSLSLLQQIFPTQESNWRNRTALQVDSLPTELIREAQDYLLIQYHC